MSAPSGNSDGGSGGGGGQNPLPGLASLSVSSQDAAQRRLALARAARENATREEIEARGIRPDVQQILRHMNEAPSHSFKRVRLDGSAVRKIYAPEDDDSDDGDIDDQNPDRNENGLPEEEKDDDDDSEFEEQWQSLLAEQGLQSADAGLVAEFRRVTAQRLRLLKQGKAAWDAVHRPRRARRFDLIGALSQCTELAVEVGKHLRPADIVRLYSISRDFHGAISANLRSSVLAWAAVMAPSSARVYSSPVYCRWFVPDPAGRPVTAADRQLSRPQPGQARIDGQPALNRVEGQVRLVPGLLWLQMVVNREIRVRDILATLARMGHRLPPGAHLTLKKMWLVMDAATTQARMLLMSDPDFFTNEDLYVAQLFMVKLVLAFNDPVFGPQSSTLMRLMLGQRGLSPLWALLRGKKYRSPDEIRELKLRYDVGPEQVQVQQGMPLYGVEVDELGVVHFEGWGTGRDHLMRPDELVPLEAARRQLDLDKCVDEMLIYGHVDPATGNSLVPSLDEMYMSDDELPPAHRDWAPLRHELVNGGCGNVPFEAGMWQPKHARKARWKTLTDEERAMLLKEEELEMAEVAALDGAQQAFRAAWNDLAMRAADITARRSMRSKYKLLEPTLEDLRGQLADFEALLARPRDPDAMDVDSDLPHARSSSAVATPSTLQQQPAAPDTNQASNNNESSLAAAAADDDDDDESLDLTLEPIPRAELERIFAAFRPRRGRPQDTDTDTSEDEYEYQDQDQDQDEYQTHPNRPPSATPSLSSSTSTTASTASAGSLPNPAAHLAATLAAAAEYNELMPPRTGAVSDEMLLAQADEDEDEGEDENEDSDGDGDGDGSQRSGGVEIDWDDFLRNPGAYVVEGAQGHEAGEENDEEDEEEDEERIVPLPEEMTMMIMNGEGNDGDGGEEADDEEEEEEEEEDEEDENDTVMGGQEQQGQQGQQGGGSGSGGQGGGQDEGEDAEDDEDEDELARYVADEDVGEDMRTKRLRDWFRPW